MKRWSNVVSLAALGLALSPAGALADPSAAVGLTVPASAVTGSPLSFQVAASFTAGSNGSQALTVFLVAPQTGGCPARAVPPHGADVVLSGEAADQVLIVNALSAPLRTPGSWTVCGYLTAQGAVTASASQTVEVTGAPLAGHQTNDHPNAGHKNTSKHHSKAAKHGHGRHHGRG